MAAGLLWLAMNLPGVCGAMLGKLEDDDTGEYINQEPSRLRRMRCGSGYCP